MRQQVRSSRYRLAGILLCALLFAWQSGQAQPVEFDIAPQGLSGALREFRQQTEMQLVYAPGDVEGRQSPGVRGAHDPVEALELLTTGTGLIVEQSDTGIVTIRMPTAAEAAPGREPPVDAPQADFEQVTVTATRREKALGDLPIAVSVLSAPELAARGARDITDVANWLPAVPGAIRRCR